MKNSDFSSCATTGSKLVDIRSWCVFRVKSPFSTSSGVVWTENIWCVFRVKSPFSNSSGVVWTENIWCVFRVKPPFSTSSVVVWTENIWCVFRVKSPFSNFSGVVWTENIWCVFRVKQLEEILFSMSLYYQLLTWLLQFDLKGPRCKHVAIVKHGKLCFPHSGCNVFAKVYWKF